MKKIQSKVNCSTRIQCCYKWDYVKMWSGSVWMALRIVVENAQQQRQIIVPSVRGNKMVELELILGWAFVEDSHLKAKSNHQSHSDTHKHTQTNKRKKQFEFSKEYFFFVFSKFQKVDCTKNGKNIKESKRIRIGFAQSAWHNEEVECEKSGQRESDESCRRIGICCWKEQEKGRPSSWQNGSRTP